MASSSSDFIKAIQPIPFAKYRVVSSREKLVVYAIKYLTDNAVATTFDHVAMATFRLFPEEFRLSNEFPDQADIAGINRTLLHLRPAERNLATGKTSTRYELTPKGVTLARQVELCLEHDLQTTKIDVSRHDLQISGRNEAEYTRFIRNPRYAKWLSSEQYSINDVWLIFETVPFTELETIHEKLKTILMHAKKKNDANCVRLASQMMGDITSLIDQKKIIYKGVR